MNLGVYVDGANDLYRLVFSCILHVHEFGIHKVGEGVLELVQACCALADLIPLFSQYSEGAGVPALENGSK